jgi:hypothetical protein
MKLNELCRKPSGEQLPRGAAGHSGTPDGFASCRRHHLELIDERCSHANVISGRAVAAGDSRLGCCQNGHAEYLARNHQFEPLSCSRASTPTIILA